MNSKLNYMPEPGKTPCDLIQLAALDALGLLDPEERDAFETAFRAAPPAVQAQIRREQLRFTDDDTLPAVEPPVGLRAKVLAAVRAAMQQAKGKRVETRNVLATIRPPTGVNRLWRTAAIGSLAAALAMTFIALQIRSEFFELSQVANNSEAAKLLQREFGNQFTPAFFGTSTHFVKFTPPISAGASERSIVKATLLLDPTTRRAQLFCKDLPTSDQPFEVVVVDQHGNEVSAVLTFKASNAGIVHNMIEGLTVDEGSTLVIRQQGAQKPLLTSNGL
jgi:hypothetical protein